MLPILQAASRRPLSHSHAWRLTARPQMELVDADSLLYAALGGVCAEWLVADSVTCEAVSAAESARARTDCAFRLVVAVRLVAVTLRYLMPGGLTPEPESNKSPRLARFLPQLEAFMTAQLHARPHLATGRFLVALKSIAILINWEPEKLGRLLLHGSADGVATYPHRVFPLPARWSPLSPAAAVKPALGRARTRRGRRPLRESACAVRSSRKPHAAGSGC